jgi:hypothetical protein
MLRCISITSRDLPHREEKETKSFAGNKGNKKLCWKQNDAFRLREGAFRYQHLKPLSD